jgi:hypothetical protein
MRTDYRERVKLPPFCTARDQRLPSKQDNYG